EGPRLPDGPRTEPYVENYLIRLLPRMRDGEAHARIRVEDARARQPPGRQLRETLPGHPGALAPPVEDPSPRSRHLVPERVQTTVVRRHSMVVEVPLHHRP